MKEATQRAAEYLAKHDKVLAPVIARSGLCTLRPNKDYYWELVDAIISQQLSTKAARSIEDRFMALYPGNLPTPDQILITSHEKLRSVGLSNAKAVYVRDLAQHIVDGKLELEKFDNLSNDEVITELTAVKGIGEWTAHMFLIFCMGRLNILAHGDLGIKNGIRKLYRLDHSPTSQEIQDLVIKNHWHPYESVACWYIWQSLDSEPI